MCLVCGLTFELRRDQREDARPDGGMISKAGRRAWRLAVGPRLERGVRPHMVARQVNCLLFERRGATPSRPGAEQWRLAASAGKYAGVHHACAAAVPW